MSDSEDEFASAGEEVNDEEIEGAKGENRTLDNKKTSKATKETKAVSESRQEEKTADEELEKSKPSTDGDSVKEGEKSDNEPKKATEVIQRQPPGGFAHPEEARDPRSALDNLATKESGGGGGGGGGWGFGGWSSSLWGTARSSVSAFTTQLGEGIHTVVETVESALEVPPPEEMAQADGDDKSAEKREPEGEAKEEKEKEEEEEKKKSQATDGSWWGVTSSMMNSAQKTTRGLMTGGLDVLESIGKKTMEALHETDPGLARTRELLAVGGSGSRARASAGATLSQALREARQRHEEAAQLEKRWEAERLGHFGAQFEDCQGLAHLEALELLAQRAEAKLHSRLGQLAGEDLSTARQDLVRLKTVFERVEEEEEEEEEAAEAEVRSCEETCKEVAKALHGLQVAAKEEILRTAKVKEALFSKALTEQPEEEEKEEEKEEEEEEEEKDEGAKKEKAEELRLKAILQAGVQLLAHATASWVGLFHKIGELALAGALRWTDEGGEEIIDLLAVTERLVNSALLASTAIGSLGEEVAILLREHSSESSRRQATQLVSAIYLETGNSKSYVRDALVLLLPVMQLASLK